MEKANKIEYFNKRAMSKPSGFTKRFVDIFISFAALICSTPIFILISIFYLFGDNKGPVFFKQKRVGVNGEIFYIYKFRSMVVDAEKKLKENKALYKKYLERGYKLEPHEDPRISKFGRFLRQSSLDELPQFINVLKGDMSLIGPRPVIEEELKEYKERKYELLSVKPGMTGYWQVNGRSDVGYPERVDLELYYVQNQSLLLDFKIFFKTIEVILLKKGAY